MNTQYETLRVSDLCVETNYARPGGQWFDPDPKVAKSEAMALLNSFVSLGGSGDESVARGWEPSKPAIVVPIKHKPTCTVMTAQVDHVREACDTKVPVLTGTPLYAVIAGCRRVSVCYAFGLDMFVPCLVITDATEDELIALAVRENEDSAVGAKSMTWRDRLTIANRMYLAGSSQADMRRLFGDGNGQKAFVVCETEVSHHGILEYCMTENKVGSWQTLRDLADKTECGDDLIAALKTGKDPAVKIKTTAKELASKAESAKGTIVGVILTSILEGTREYLQYAAKDVDAAMRAGIEQATEAAETQAAEAEKARAELAQTSKAQTSKAQTSKAPKARK